MIALNLPCVGTLPEIAGKNVTRPFMLLSVLQSFRPAIFDWRIRLARWILA